MNKQEIINNFKKRYEYCKFKVEYPVLDIGGGDGLFLESQGIEKALIIDGTKDKNPKYKYITRDITKKLPKLKGKFKTIFLTEVLEHIKNPLYLLAQVYDLLDDSGVCYIAIPHTEIGPEHHHVCRWKLNEIVSQTEKLGFLSKVIQKRRRFLGFGFWLPHCWLVLSLRKRVNNSNLRNKECYNLEV